MSLTSTCRLDLGDPLQVGRRERAGGRLVAGGRAGVGRRVGHGRHVSARRRRLRPASGFVAHHSSPVWVYMVSLRTVRSSSSISLSRSMARSSSTFASWRSKACCTTLREASARASVWLISGGGAAAAGEVHVALDDALRGVQVVGEEPARGVELARLGGELRDDLVGGGAEADHLVAHGRLADGARRARGSCPPGGAPAAAPRRRARRCSWAACGRAPAASTGGCGAAGSARGEASPNMIAL